MAKKTSKRATAKVFTTGRSQAVRIPKEYRFSCDKVLIEREGERVILTPRPKSWREYFARASRFTDDYPDSIDDRPARASLVVQARCAEELGILVSAPTSAADRKAHRSTQESHRVQRAVQRRLQDSL